MLAKRFVAVKNENKARLKRPISKNLEKKSHSAKKIRSAIYFCIRKIFGSVRDSNPRTPAS